MKIEDKIMARGKQMLARFINHTNILSTKHFLNKNNWYQTDSCPIQWISVAFSMLHVSKQSK